MGVLLEKYIKFAIGVPFSTGMAKEAVRENAAAVTGLANAIEVDGHIYYATVEKQTINGGGHISTYTMTGKGQQRSMTG